MCTCQLVLDEMFSTMTRYGVRNGGMTLQTSTYIVVVQTDTHLKHIEPLTNTQNTVRN